MIAIPGKSERVYKVALFGVTGCGKSSIINLLADKPVANVSTGVEVCTRRAQWYPVSLGEKKFRVWDTMGFNQADAKDINPLSPYEQAHALLQNLQEGVDLILLCARKDGINASLRKLYWLLDSLFFGGRAPIALVLTHFDTPDEDWWDRNRHIIAQRCNIPVQFLPHACITTVQNGSSTSDSIYHQSQQALKALLQEHAVSPTPLRLDLSSDITSAEVAESLKNHCQLKIVDAATLVETFIRSPKRAFRTILFGEAGAGKSSVINLILGENVAEISSDIESCTLDYCRYEINTGSNHFLVWDTVGFNAMQNKRDATKTALDNAARLVRELHREGGVDLLVFCKKQGRVSPTELNVLKLFREVLCEGHIPVAFIITNLDSSNYDPMEKWWEKNGKGLLEAYDLKASAVAGHVCITSAPDDPDNRTLREKRSLSRQLVQTMFEDSITFGTAFSNDEGVWVMSFLKRVVGIMKAGNPSKKDNLKTSVKTLMDCYGLTREQADELMKSIRGRSSRLIL